MKFYIELTLRPQDEVPIYFLWEKVYPQVHLALVEVQDSKGTVDIGVSFPRYDARQFELGCKLRLFAEDKRRLKELNIKKWLSRLTDYVQISDVEIVPDGCAYVFYKRTQPKSSNARMARRKAKREGISFEGAINILNSRSEKVSRLPYIYIKSLSSEKGYKLFIDMRKSEQNQIGKFSTYGLSSQATVPWF